MEKIYIDSAQKIIGIPGDQFPVGRRCALYIHKNADKEFRIRFVPNELINEIIEKHKKELFQHDYLIFFIRKNDNSFGDFSLAMFKKENSDFIVRKYETGFHDLWRWSSKVIFIFMEYT